jgi:SAM-dependent methyltransferase
MGNRLPFPDGHFDVVLSLEGIEHIDGQETFLRELRRVLKPGGRLILSTPNMLCLRSRLAYALAGQRTFRTFIDEYTAVQARDATRVYHGHVFMLDYFQLRYLLHHSGFHLKSLLRPRYSPTSVILTPFLMPLAAIFTRLAQRKSRRKFTALKAAGRIPDTEMPPYGEITRHVLSPALMWGTIVVAEAEAC